MSRDLKILSTAMLIWGLGEGMFIFFQPLYLQQWGADPILIGTILGINGLVMTAAQIPSGYMADKIGRRPLIWFSFILGAVATWVMALAPSLAVFVVGLMMYGLTSSVMAPLNTYVQAARGRLSVGRAVSLVSAAYNGGAILGPILGGLVGEMLDLKMIYFISAALFTISTLVELFIKAQAVEDGRKIDGEGHLFQNKAFLSLLLIIFLVMFAVSLPQPLAPNFLQNQRGLSLSQIGQLGSLFALGSVVIMLILGQLPTAAAMIFGQVGMLIYSFLLWRGTGLVWYGIAYFFMGGYRLCRAMTVVLVRPVVREREVGLAFGVVESLNSLAFVAAPIIAGFLYDWQPIIVFPVSVIIIGITLLITFVHSRHARSSGERSLAASPLEVEDDHEA